MLQTAIILAGGFGTRLQTVVKDLPKPLAPVNGQPFLNYQLNYLKHFGITDVIFSLGYLSEKIKATYQNEYNGINISYVVEHEALGTGGGIRLAMQSSVQKEALVLNGDSFFEVDLHTFYKQHQSAASEVSLALREVKDASRYGTIETDANNRIKSFKEKSTAQQTGFINGGVYLINKNTYLKNTPEALNFSIEKDFFEKQNQQIPMYGFLFEGYFLDIGIPNDYQQAQNDFKRFKY